MEARQTLRRAGESAAKARVLDVGRTEEPVILQQSLRNHCKSAAEADVDPAVKVHEAFKRAS